MEAWPFAGADKHKATISSCLFYVCVPLVNYLLGFSICLLTFVANHSSNACTQSTRYLGPLFLVSPLYFSIPSRATFDHNPRLLYLRYAYKLFRGFWEMDGLSGCVFCLVNKILSPVGRPFQSLRKSSGKQDSR